KAQMGTGLAYSNRVQGDPEENIEAAIRHYQSALQTCSATRFPDTWSSVQHNLGGAYLRQQKGDRAGNIERALAHFEQALPAVRLDQDGEKWARVHGDAGTAYRNRPRGNRADNRAKAIEHCKFALSFFDRHRYPIDRAGALYGLMGAYMMPTGDSFIDDLE